MCTSNISCYRPVVSDLVLWCDRGQSKRFVSEDSADANTGLVDVDDGGLEHTNTMLVSYRLWLNSIATLNISVHFLNTVQAH